MSGSLHCCHPSREDHHFRPRRCRKRAPETVPVPLAFRLPLLRSVGKQFVHSLSQEAGTEQIWQWAWTSFQSRLCLLHLGLKSRDHVLEHRSVGCASEGREGLRMLNTSVRPASLSERRMAFVWCQVPLPEDLKAILAILGPEIDWRALMREATGKSARLLSQPSAVCRLLCASRFPLPRRRNSEEPFRSLPSLFLLLRSFLSAFQPLTGAATHLSR